MSRIGKVNTLVAVTWMLAMVVTLCCGGNPSQIANRWVIADCNAPSVNVVGFFSSENEMILAKCTRSGFPQNMELLRDGSGIVDGSSNPWKTQDSRIYFMGSPARAFNYKLSGSAFTLIDNNGNKATYLEPLAAENFIMEQSKKQQEIEEQLKMEAELKRLREEDMRLEKTIYFTDSRDGRKYRAVKIANMTWMAENLNYETPGSGCYNNNSSNCDKYGRLYILETAKTACPDGWHLPSAKEWYRLELSGGGSSEVGRLLKSTKGWNNAPGETGNGTDSFGFSALPGGLRAPNGRFGNVGYDGYWWTATVGGKSGSAEGRGMNYRNNKVGSYDIERGNACSVRCVQD
jgi:uncharacterized protein (TIGR02145 family)